MQEAGFLRYAGLKLLDAAVSDPYASTKGLGPKDFTKVVAGAAFYASIAPYGILTAFRNLGEPLGIHAQGATSSSEKWAVSLGIGIGIASIVAQAIGYGVLAYKGHAKALLFPTFTNAWSLYAEFPRFMERIDTIINERDLEIELVQTPGTDTLDDHFGDGDS